MNRTAGRLRPAGLLALGLVVACNAGAACLSISAQPSGEALARLGLAEGERAFSLSYVHSVTRTPVDERYRVEGASIVQESIAFEAHGPGLPTEHDALGGFERRDGRMVMTMARRFPRIVMRVHADQSPALHARGRTLDLAAWGNRSLALSASDAGCDG